jgi:hypothetical protein
MAQVVSFNYKSPFSLLLNSAEKALEYFHKRVTQVNLKKFLKKVGVDKFEKLQLLFPEIRNCGYTIDEIQSSSHDILGIKRKKYRELSPDVSTIKSLSDSENESSSDSDSSL